MESMRSLNTSLPRSPRKNRSNQPPEQLIQAFKTAALSVTNLYKTAAADQVVARQAGYQDALDDVLAFLDKENLGLDDGEGWKVRQWATERLDGSASAQAGSDDDDDRTEAPKRARSTSPAPQRARSSDIEQNRRLSNSPSRTVSAPVGPPVGPPVSTTTQTMIAQTPEAFTFRSTLPYPQDIDMPTRDNASNSMSPAESPLHLHTPTSGPPASVRVEVVPCGNRTPHRGANHPSRHTTRSITSTRGLGSGAGSKRRVPLGDYFDLSSLGDRWDVRDGSSGAAKRGRFT